MIDNDVRQAANFVGKLIRNGNSFTKALRIASGYYKVDRDDVEAEVRRRSSKSEKRHKSRTYHYYIVDEYEVYEYRDDYFEHEADPSKFKIVRATCKSNAGKCSKASYGFQNESCNYTRRDVIGEFETQKEAKEHLANLIKEGAK